MSEDYIRRLRQQRHKVFFIWDSNIREWSQVAAVQRFDQLFNNEYFSSVGFILSD